jgi:ABC-type phosphate transport system permease subunit
MFIGRIVGWSMIAVALLMASGEAVMALGTGSYHGLATSDVWALLWGQTPQVEQTSSAGSMWLLIVTVFMAMPAWAVVGPVGVILAHVCRRRPPRGRLFLSA